jgi:hypothetical protein
MQIVALIVFFAMLFAIVGMWRRRKGEVDVRVDPAYDPAEGQPEAREALGYLQGANWSALTRLYWRLAPSDRYHLIQSLGRLAGPAGPPDLPEDADSALIAIAGGMSLMRGLTFQTSGGFDAVLRANAPRMVEDLRNADRTLREGAIRNPHDSTCLALQILVEGSTNRDRALINSLVGRIQASGEDNLFAGVNHLLSCLPRPGETFNNVWTVANEWASAGPNAAWLAIPARAHIEEWRYAIMLSPLNAPERSAMIDLLQDDGFKRHLARLDDQFWSTVTRSPMSGAEAAFAHNHLAFLMHIFRVDDRAKRHLDQIGPYVSRFPWSLLPTGASHPTRLLSDLRREYGLPALAAPARR